MEGKGLCKTCARACKQPLGVCIQCPYYERQEELVPA